LVYQVLVSGPSIHLLPKTSLSKSGTGEHQIEEHFNLATLDNLGSLQRSDLAGAEDDPDPRAHCLQRLFLQQRPNRFTSLVGTCGQPAPG